MSEEVRKAAEAVARSRDRRPGEPRHDWIRERLEKLARKDELLRQIGYLPREEDGNADE